jgi:hypothetical protein
MNRKSRLKCVSFAFVLIKESGRERDRLSCEQMSKERRIRKYRVTEGNGFEAKPNQSNKRLKGKTGTRQSVRGLDRALRKSKGSGLILPKITERKGERKSEKRQREMNRKKRNQKSCRK